MSKSSNMTLPLSEMFPTDTGGAYRRELVYWGKHGPVILRVPTPVDGYEHKLRQPIGWIRMVRRQIESMLALMPSARRVDLSMVEETYSMQVSMRIVVVDADSVHLHATIIAMEDLL